VSAFQFHRNLLLKGIEAVSIHGGKVLVSKEQKRLLTLVSLIDPCFLPSPTIVLACDPYLSAVSKNAAFDSQAVATNVSSSSLSRDVTEARKGMLDSN
jgi:hypothetical protein